MAGDSLKRLLPALLLLTFFVPWADAGEYAGVFSVSAYCDVGMMAGGRETYAGAAACGPGVAFGTQFILGDGRIVECMDRGGLVTDRHIDVWMDSCEAAIQWGRRDLPAWRIR